MSKCGITHKGVWTYPYRHINNRICLICGNIQKRGWFFWSDV